MPGSRRVVITGIGVISALGRNAAEFWESLAAGRCGIGLIQSTDMTGMRFTNGGEVHDYNPCDYFHGKETDFLDRFAQFAVIAGREAVRDSGMKWEGEAAERSAVVTGSCVGGQSTENEGYRNLYEIGRAHV
jgi:nodulation protein E